MPFEEISSLFIDDSYPIFESRVVSKKLSKSATLWTRRDLPLNLLKLNSGIRLSQKDCASKRICKISTTTARNLGVPMASAKATEPLQENKKESEKPVANGVKKDELEELVMSPVLFLAD